MVRPPARLNHVAPSWTYSTVVYSLFSPISNSLLILIYRSPIPSCGAPRLRLSPQVNLTNYGCALDISREVATFCMCRTSPRTIRAVKNAQRNLRTCFDTLRNEREQLKGKCAGGSWGNMAHNPSISGVRRPFVSLFPIVPNRPPTTSTSYTIPITSIISSYDMAAQTFSILRGDGKFAHQLDAVSTLRLYHSGSLQTFSSCVGVVCQVRPGPRAQTDGRTSFQGSSDIRKYGEVGFERTAIQSRTLLCTPA